MMNKKDIFAKIGTIVKEIHEQHDYLSANPESLNELELELFLANSKFLTGHIEVFQKLARAEAASQPVIKHSNPILPGPAETKDGQPEQTRNIEQPAAAPALSPPPPVSEKEQEALPVGDSEEPEQVLNKIYLDVEPIEDEPVEDGLLAEAAHEPGNKPEGAVEQIAEPVSEGPAASVPEPTTFAAPALTPEPEAVPTLNDIISAQLNAQPTLAGQFTAKPVKDLKSIINLNDKLLFIKDLFNGYSLAYSEAIELLNRFDNFEAADNFLKSNYATKNNWAAKQSTADHFYEILNRRFLQ